MNLLVVEDNKEHMAWLRSLLRERSAALGCHVRRYTTNWTRALRLLKTKPDEFDVVISDLQDARTKEFRGFEVLQAARTSGKGAIAVSSFLDDEENVRDIISSGADFYVKKPFKPEWREWEEYVKELERSADLSMYFALRQLGVGGPRRARAKQDVFLSYSNKDRNVATSLAGKLDTEGVSYFMAEKSIRGGEVWESALRRALRASRVVLVLLTKNSISSPWVLCEAGAAWGLGKPLLPALHSGKLADVPEAITRHQCVHIGTTEGTAELLRTIKQLV